MRGQVGVGLVWAGVSTPCMVECAKCFFWMEVDCLIEELDLQHKCGISDSVWNVVLTN